MIRARAAGLKWQTRRPISPYNSTIDGTRPGKAGLPDMYRADNTVLVLQDQHQAPWLSVHDPFENEAVFIKPEVQPGHSIWWKETWKIIGWDEDGGDITMRYPATNAESISVEIPEEWDPEGERFNTYWQQCCDDLIKAGIEPDGDGQYRFDDTATIPTRNRSSMLMPRWAARFVDKVIAVRPERLHDISEADAIAEGILFDKDGGFWYVHDAPPQGLPSLTALTARDCYFKLWEKLNGKQSLQANPWLWVYTMAH